MKSLKKTVILLSPLLLFAVLLIPYSLVNNHFIVKWFGCGCPVLDELGNMVENKFNANTFTAYFWLTISACTTLISALLSRKIIRGNILLKILYILGILIISLLIAYQFSQMMMLN